MTDKLMEEIDEIFQFVHAHVHDPLFVNKWLKPRLAKDLKNLSIAIAVLTGTLAIKSKLPFRPKYYEAVALKIIEQGKDPDQVLTGLK